MSDNNVPKAELRAVLRQRRDRFVSGLPGLRWQASMSQAIAHVVDQLSGARCVAGFISLGSELDPQDVLAAATDMGIQTALPWVRTQGEPMRFLRWTPGEPLSRGPYGLEQPHEDAPEVSPDLIIVPLVGFDRHGGRLGQGAGYYDRALARIPSARTIGFAWSVQEVERVPLDPWDIPLQAVATEAAFHSFVQELL